MSKKVLQLTLPLCPKHMPSQFRIARARLEVAQHWSRDAKMGEKVLNEEKAGEVVEKVRVDIHDDDLLCRS